MKRITLLLLLFVTATAFAQKAVKPNLNKALALWKEGKLDEAKTMIDAATTYEKTMTDAKTFYYKGLIYASIDTTTNETYHALAPDAFEQAVEAFKKGDEMNKGKELFIQEATGLPVLKSQQMLVLANSYLNKGATQYQEEDLENALKNFEKVQVLQPKDTTAWFYAGFVANGLENKEKTLQYFEKYMELGGKSPDAYSVLINQASQGEDKEAALKLVRDAKAKFPKNTDFPKVEIGLLIDLNRIDEAKSGLEAAVAKEPNNKILHFYLGYVNQQLNAQEPAKKHYEEALRVDPKYFEASLYLAKLMYTDAANLKKEMASLGISAADRKKKFEIDKVLVEKLKVALPYWENAEKINPKDQEVLDMLFLIYRDLGNEEGTKRIEKRFKELGLEN